MSTYVADCKKLVEEALPALCRNGAHHVYIDVTPGRILEDFPTVPVALYAQSLSSHAVLVNLMMPAFCAFLNGLASSGIGPAEHYNGVRYRFAEYTSSGTTSPMSSL
ncbi:hypothetical protein GGS24DRAFT_485430 [Hypoxylon argillaceum]|nr:hypothetical protein GGS24DRAFT_485430 [Hypoxylon argillaceum]KAI1144681.1 hypothetical protein F4825DRAFT_445720 [Nemania diffusa]